MIKKTESKENLFLVHEIYGSMIVSKSNAVNDDGIRTHIVCLPPDYYTSDRHYPVIYFFNGWYCSVELSALELGVAYDYMKEEKLHECIVIYINTDTDIGHTLLTDSSVNGLWQEAFTDELMPYFEGKYRIHRSKNARGLIGFAMGGYAAYNLALTRPELFDACYLVAPLIIDDSDINMMIEGWPDDITSTYGRAFSPRLGESPNYAVPKLDGSVRDQVIIHEWLRHVGNMNRRIEAYLSLDSQIGKFGFEVGKNDPDTFIHNGTVKLSKVFVDKGIAHTFHYTENEHRMTEASFCQRGLPFIVEHLIEDRGV